MKNMAVTALVAAVVGACAACLVGVSRGGAPADPSAEWLESNRRKVERMVLEDVERFGADIYRLHMEVSQMLPGMPDADFGADKALKKLQVTYPESNVRALSEAYVVYGAVRRRDMIRIEQYLRELEERSSAGGPQLMPNGYEIEPQLVAAQYNYLFHTGRYDEAERMLDYLVSKFGGSWLFQPQGAPLAISSFAAFQRRILAVARKEASK